MTDRELATREKFRRLNPDVEEVVDASEIEEELYQCESCRGLAFLSHEIGRASCRERVS